MWDPCSRQMYTYWLTAADYRPHTRSLRLNLLSFTLMYNVNNQPPCTSFTLTNCHYSDKALSTLTNVHVHTVCTLYATTHNKPVVFPSTIFTRGIFAFYFSFTFTTTLSSPYSSWFIIVFLTQPFMFLLFLWRFAIDIHFSLSVIVGYVIIGLIQCPLDPSLQYYLILFIIMYTAKIHTTHIKHK